MSISLMPSVVTHNFDPERPFLANLCDLPLHEAEALLQEQRDAGIRISKPNYLNRRHDTEAWLIRERRRLLGKTRRERPVYCFLGDFADGTDPLRPHSFVLPLEIFPANILTFTFPDSMASLALANLESHRLECRPYHGEVFTLEGIEKVIDEFGFPDSGSRSDRFIEVQVWDERPILDFVARP